MLREQSPKFRGGRQPDIVQHKVMANVKIAQAAPALAVEKHEARKRILVRVAKQAPGTHVNAFPPGIATLRLKSMAHPLCNPSLEALVIRTGTPGEQANRTHVGVEPNAGDRIGLRAGREEPGNARVAVPVW